MKKLLSISILALLSACGGKESHSTEGGNILENLSFSVDTVVVDPGEEIINLQFGFFYSSLSQDHRRLYMFDGANSQIQEIDLDELKLTASYPFEKEGPNGIQSFGSTITPLSGDRFLFSGFRKIGKFKKSGELIPEFDFSLEKLISGERPEQSMLSQLEFMEKSQKGFFLETAFNAPVFNLVSIDFESESSKVIDLPKMHRTHDYSIVSNEYDYPISSTQLVTVQAIDSKVYITTPVSSGVYRYDPELDSLEYVTFPLTLTPTEKTKKIRNVVSTAEERKEQTALIHSEVGFKELLWDDQSERFYRFSSILIPSNSEEPSKKNDVFLSAFDSQLNLLGEKFLEELTAIPHNAFFKDGKLYSYVNVDDELGFAVFTFDF